MLHSKKEAFTETGEKNKEEDEADQFASNYLIASTKYKNFISQNKFTRDSIIKFADEVGIDPGIVVERIHHDQKIPWGGFQDMQRKFS